MPVTSLSRPKLGTKNRQLFRGAKITRNPAEAGTHSLLLKVNAGSQRISPESLRAEGFTGFGRLLKILVEVGHSNNECVVDLVTSWQEEGFPVRVVFSRYASLPTCMNCEMSGTFGLEADEAYAMRAGVAQPTPALKEAVSDMFSDMPLVSVRKR